MLEPTPYGSVPLTQDPPVSRNQAYTYNDRNQRTRATIQSGEEPERVRPLFVDF